MTFLEALKTGRPMRRDNYSHDRPWLYLGEETGWPATPCWRQIHDGARVGLHTFDYQATDWEVMP